MKEEIYKVQISKINENELDAVQPKFIAMAEGPLLAIAEFLLTMSELFQAQACREAPDEPTPPVIYEAPLKAPEPLSERLRAAEARVADHERSITSLLKKSQEAKVQFSALDDAYQELAVERDDLQRKHDELVRRLRQGMSPWD